MAEVVNRTLTNKFRTHRILSLIENSNFIFGFGKNTQWKGEGISIIDDLNPPPASRLDSSILEPLVYKKAFNLAPVVKSSCEALDLLDCTTLQTVSEEWVLLDWRTQEDLNLLYTIDPTNLYVEVNLSKTDIDSLSLNSFIFRTVGLFAKPTFKSGVNTNKLLYLPSELSNPGILCWHANLTPQSINNTDCSKISLIFNI